MLISKQHINLPNSITILGVLFALISCGFATATRFDWAFAALAVSGLCDLFDGFFARRADRNEEQRAYGAQLDSLVDVISFGLTPAVLAYCLTEPHAFTSQSIGEIEILWAKFVAVFFVLCAILRLAHFNVVGLMDTGKDQKHQSFYQGLPVTYISVIMPIVYLVFRHLSPELIATAVSFTLFFVGLLFVSNVKIPKPYGLAYPAFLALGMFTITVLLV